MKRIAAIVTVALGSSLLAVPQDVIRVQPLQQISGCPTGNVSAPVHALEADDFVELERTGCFGSCPAYKVRIYADGRIQWQGNRDVFSAGAATSSVAPEKARALLEKYRANNFWSLCESYSAMVSDSPTYFTTVRIGDPAKRVSNYFSVAPSWVQDLESEVDVLANTYEWINGSWQTQLFAYLPDPNRGPTPPRVALVQISQAATSVRPGATPLMRAAGRGEVSEVERLLAEKADPNATDGSGWTPLMYAAGGRAPAETIPKLLAAGANPKARSAMGQTPLMAATFGSIYSTAREVKLLIDAGAEVNAQDTNGQTAIAFASSRLLGYPANLVPPRVEMLKFLRSAGARTDLPDSYGVSVLDRFAAQPRRDAAATANYEAIRKILTDEIPPR